MSLLFPRWQLTIKQFYVILMLFLVTECLNVFLLNLFLCLGGQQREIIVSKSDPKVLITDYNPSKDYIISVIAIRGREQSRPLRGRFKGLFHFLSALLE